MSDMDNRESPETARESKHGEKRSRSKDISASAKAPEVKLLP